MSYASCQKDSQTIFAKGKHSIEDDCTPGVKASMSSEHFKVLRWVAIHEPHGAQVGGITLIRDKTITCRLGTSGCSKKGAHKYCN